MSPVIIITGASKGIGKAATLEALEKFDAKVVAIARSSALLDELHAHVEKTLNKGHQLELVVGDVTDEKVVHKAVNIAVDKWGRLDSVIANAGYVFSSRLVWRLCLIFICDSILEPIANIAEAPVEGWKRYT